MMNQANAAAAAAAAGGLQVPPALPLSTFTEYYNDARQDEYQGDYGGLMNEFNAVGGRAPGELRNLATMDPESSLGYLYLVEAPGDPQHHGYFQVIHSVSRFGARLGFPATVWDDRRFGTVGDVVNGQVPNTVFFPNDSFTLAAGGHLVCLPTPGRLTAEFVTTPGAQLVGPYQNNPIGTQWERVRSVVPVPHKYMCHFLSTRLTPREAWELVFPAIEANGDHLTCQPLVDFLRLACTRTTVGRPNSILVRPPFEVAMADSILIKHRTDLIAVKLPALRQGQQLAAGQRVAEAIDHLTEQQRLTREEATARSQAAATKTVQDFFGPALLSVLRVCHVASEDQLPSTQRSPNRMPCSLCNSPYYPPQTT